MVHKRYLGPWNKEARESKRETKNDASSKGSEADKFMKLLRREIFCPRDQHRFLF